VESFREWRLNGSPSGVAASRVVGWAVLPLSVPPFGSVLRPGWPVVLFAFLALRCRFVIVSYLVNSLVTWPGSWVGGGKLFAPCGGKFFASYTLLRSG